MTSFDLMQSRFLGQCVATNIPIFPVDDGVSFHGLFMSDDALFKPVVFEKGDDVFIIDPFLPMPEGVSLV